MRSPKLRLTYKGSQIRAGYDLIGLACLWVDDRKIAARALFAFNGSHLKPVLEAIGYCEGGTADLALYIRKEFLIEQWVLMDGDDVIAATHPSRLPSSRRPGAKP